MLLQTMSLLIIKQYLHVTQVEAVATTHQQQLVCCSECPRGRRSKMYVALGEDCLIPVAWLGTGTGLFV